MGHEDSKKKRILLIEDDKGLSATIKNFLEERDYAVRCVYDGEEGLNTAEIMRCLKRYVARQTFKHLAA